MQGTFSAEKSEGTTWVFLELDDQPTDQREEPGDFLTSSKTGTGQETSGSLRHLP